MAYKLEGSLLEVCTCKALCPCWVNEEPDGGTCDGTLAWHFDKGQIDGVDVSGLTLAAVAHLPGKALDGNWRAALYIDEKATAEQEQALLSVFTGKKGGPVADLAQLIGEVVTVERAPITAEVEKGKGRLSIGAIMTAELEPFVGATKKPTTLQDTVFSTVAGAPAYVGKAPTYKVINPALGIDVNLSGHNSIQAEFVFEG